MFGTATDGTFKAKDVVLRWPLYKSVTWKVINAKLSSRNQWKSIKFLIILSWYSWQIWHWVDGNFVGWRSKTAFSYGIWKQFNDWNQSYTRCHEHLWENTKQNAEEGHRITDGKSRSIDRTFKTVGAKWTKKCAWPDFWWYNYDSFEKAIADRVLDALRDRIANSEGTVRYLLTFRDIADSFSNHDLTPLHRLHLLYRSVFFLNLARIRQESTRLQFKRNFFNS